MAGKKCPFSVIQAAQLAHCQFAEKVVRKGGAEFDCQNSQALVLCQGLDEHLKFHAFPVLGHEDDLTLTPINVYERVQIGGLAGLNGIKAGEDLPRIEDIWTIVDAAITTAGTVEEISASVFVPTIESCKLKRNRRRG